MTHSEQPDPTSDQTRTRKKALRASIRAAREARPAAERQAFAARLAAWSPPPGTRRVSCFIGVGAEPDTTALIESLAARGIEVLLPITLDDLTLDWALYTGHDDLVAGRYGLLEPAGPRLGASGLATADVVVVPALAIDAEGRRLGQGAGCYDQALPHVASGTPIWAVVHDDERLTEPLPEEPHDRRVDGVIP